MSLEQAIHQRWSDCASLAALVPAVRVFTGTAPGGTDMPYAVLVRTQSAPAARTSSGIEIERVQLVLSMYAATLEEAKAAAAAVRACFARQAFPLTEGECLQLAWNQSSEERSPDGVWRASVELSALVRHAIGQ